MPSMSQRDRERAALAPNAYRQRKLRANQEMWDGDWECVGCHEVFRGEPTVASNSGGWGACRKCAKNLGL